MCRLLAAPPGTSREETLEILKRMEFRNKDGFGYTFLKNGEFVTYKWALSFTELVKRGYPLLNHMPGDSWTIVHQRAASCGGIAKENSHPFVVGNRWSICHNGSFREHRIISFALSNHMDLKGQTDSEVAANLINCTSPREFAMNEEIVGAGVYLCLNRNGSLEVVKNSGDLCFHERKDGSVLLSSELSYINYKQSEALRGWYKFNPDGKFAKFVKREWNSRSYKGEAWLYGGGNFKTTNYGHGNVGGFNVSSHHEFSGD